MFESSITITRTPDRGFASATSRYPVGSLPIGAASSCKVPSYLLIGHAVSNIDLPECRRQTIGKGESDYRAFPLGTISKRTIINKFNRSPICKLLLNFEQLKVFLARAALGTTPTDRHILPSRPWWNSIIGPTARFFVNQATNEAHPGFVLCRSRHDRLSGLQYIVDTSRICIRRLAHIGCRLNSPKRFGSHFIS